MAAAEADSREARVAAVTNWLSLYNLASYAEAFEEQGFDSLPHLLRASEADVVELIAVVGMTKVGHLQRLRRALSGKPPPPTPAQRQPAPPLPQTEQRKRHQPPASSSDSADVVRRQPGAARRQGCSSGVRSFTDGDAVQRG